MVVISLLGKTDGEQLFGLLLAAAITLTLLSAITRHVTAPRTAYRLGWDARDRHGRQPDAKVVHMDEQRRA